MIESWEQFKDFWVIALLLLLSAIGGLLGSIIRQIDSKQPFNWIIIVIETAVSAFGGVVVMLLCSYLELDYRLTGAVVAVCGWFGGRTTMLWLEHRVKRVVKGDNE